MGKYLIKGALALFAGALVLSCAETETEYVPVAQQKINAFEDVFKEVYGDIDPYQDWGFEQGKVSFVNRKLINQIIIHSFNKAIQIVAAIFGSSKGN